MTPLQHRSDPFDGRLPDLLTDGSHRLRGLVDSDCSNQEFISLFRHGRPRERLQKSTALARLKKLLSGTKAATGTDENGSPERARVQRK